MGAAEGKHAKTAATIGVEAKPGIDYEKLRSLGVPEEVIAQMDPRDGGNITPEGEVLYLDEGRMRRKEHPEKPMYKNRPNGTGLMNWVVTGPLATTPGTWGRTNLLFKLLVANFHRLHEEGLVAEAFKRVMMFEPQGSTHSHGNVMQLNVDLADEGKSTVVPYDLLMDMIDRAEYIALMDRCLCRCANGCTDGREGFGCLFLNGGGALQVKNGIARQVTKEQAKQHVREAKDMGLMGNVLWVQLEQLVWGIPNDKLDEMTEICFCDPEYCVAIRAVRAGSPQIKERFHASGFTAVIDHGVCEACGACVKSCPQDAISIADDGKVVIDQERCMGCGFCRADCPHGAMALRQTMPLRGSVSEYFSKEGRIDLVTEKCTIEPPEAGYEWHPGPVSSFVRSHKKGLAGVAAGAVALAVLVSVAKKR